MIDKSVSAGVPAATLRGQRQWRVIIPAPVKMLGANDERDWQRGPNHHAWRETAYAKLVQAGVARGLTAALFELELRFLGKRDRRNQTNYHSTIAKPVVDAAGPERRYVIQRGKRKGQTVLERGWGVVADDTSPPLHCPDCPHIRFGEPLTAEEKKRWPDGVAILTITELLEETS